MNRHRAYWSAMGYEVSEEEARERQEKRKDKRQKEKKAIKRIVLDHNTFLDSGISYVQGILKEIAEEMEEW